MPKKQLVPICLRHCHTTQAPFAVDSHDREGGNSYLFFSEAYTETNWKQSHMGDSISPTPTPTAGSWPSEGLTGSRMDVFYISPV